MIRVLALVTLPSLGASNRLRVEQYAPLLKERGISLTVSPFFDDATYRILYQPGHAAGKALGVARGVLRRLRDLLRARRYDLVLVHRESAPLGPPLVERALGLLGRRYVFDFDDAIQLAPVHPSNRRWGFLRHPSRVSTAVRGATAVIAGNEYLAEWARERNENVTVISTPVDAERHQPAPGAKEVGPLVIGWVGSSTTAPYLRLLDDALQALARDHDLVVRVVGGDYQHPSARVEVVPYDLSREADLVRGFDIGVLPEPDDPWTRGKGAFKALLYMSSGVPTVASRVGVNEDVIGDAGYCVDGTAGWIEALRRLAVDPALRVALGARGRTRVLARHSIEVQVPRLAGVLTAAAR